ncbi:hypothetical protein B0T19DRAFT_28135 [Cercophora scortea]|uniref:Uncharacterized protein n=1 Tax=Cercophora scortea TaxID=314031 RepID=A0AAE0J354_9PEZI|nr:hypothetical protein B0T19DRAFT_28135 [Cercophora scortea]
MTSDGEWSRGGRWMHALHCLPGAWCWVGILGLCYDHIRPTMKGVSFFRFSFSIFLSSSGAESWCVVFSPGKLVSLCRRGRLYLGRSGTRWTIPSPPPFLRPPFLFLVLVLVAYVVFGSTTHTHTHTHTNLHPCTVLVDAFFFSGLGGRGAAACWVWLGAYPVGWYGTQPVAKEGRPRGRGKFTHTRPWPGPFRALLRFPANSPAELPGWNLFFFFGTTLFGRGAGRGGRRGLVVGILGQRSDAPKERGTATNCASGGISGAHNCIYLLVVFRAQT